MRGTFVGSRAFGVIQCTCDFCENTIFKMLILLYLWFFCSQTFCRCSLWQITQTLLLGILKFKIKKKKQWKKYWNLTLWQMEKWKLSWNWLIEQNLGFEGTSGTDVWLFLPYIVQGHLEVIQCTCNYSENVIVTILLLLHFWVPSTKLFIATPWDSPHKSDLLELWNKV